MKVELQAEQTRTGPGTAGPFACRGADLVEDAFSKVKIDDLTQIEPQLLDKILDRSYKAPLIDVWVQHKLSENMSTYDPFQATAPVSDLEAEHRL